MLSRKTSGAFASAIDADWHCGVVANQPFTLLTIHSRNFFFAISMPLPLDRYLNN